MTTQTQFMQAQAVLNSLPDIIQAAVLEIGVDLNNAVPAADQPGTAFNFIPPDLTLAFKNGDYQKIEQITQAGAKDMDPIYANMQQHEDQAWIQIINQSNNTPYWISIAGDPAKPTGYMWTYTDPKPLAATNVAGDPGFVHTVQVGTLSRNTKLIGISNQLWDNKALSLTTAAISTVVTAVLTKYISSRITGTAFATALQQACVKAGQALISRGIVTEAGWLAGSALVGKFVGGALVGAALTLLVMFIAEFVWRDYKICVNIYNYTTKPLQVTEYWGDNEKIDDDQPFVQGALPATSTTVTLPDGMGAPTTGSQIVSYATYVFQNKNKFLEGLGVAMRVAPGSDNKGVLLGYYLGRFADNKLALSSDMSQTLEQFYKASGSWAPGGSLKWSITLPDKTSVICSTPALKGRDDQFYEYNVCIGLAPSSSFGDKLPEGPPRERRAYPKVPKQINIGDKVTLADGHKTEVVGKLQPQFMM